MSTILEPYTYAKRHFQIVEVLIQIQPKDLGDASQGAEVACFERSEVVPYVEPNRHPVDVGFDAPAKVVAKLVDIGGAKDVVELELDPMKA